MGIFRRKRRVTALGPNRWSIQLAEGERATLGHLLPQLRDLLTAADAADPRLRRLFPTAYLNDAEADAEYHRFMRDELVQSKLSGLEALEASLEQTELTDAELTGWMQSINSVRLVLGTLLDVSEDSRLVDNDDPDIDGHLLYDYLSGLLDDIVTAQIGD